jgi:hypothetical protein
MNNANMPASPIMCDKGHPTHYSFLLNATLGEDKRASGLTKREYFAGLAFQAVMSGMYDPKVNHNWSFKDFASEAVNAADALLKELEK